MAISGSSATTPGPTARRSTARPTRSTRSPTQTSGRPSSSRRPRPTRTVREPPPCQSPRRSSPGAPQRSGAAHDRGDPKHRGRTDREPRHVVEPPDLIRVPVGRLRQFRRELHRDRRRGRSDVHADLIGRRAHDPRRGVSHERGRERGAVHLRGHRRRAGARAPRRDHQPSRCRDLPARSGRQRHLRVLRRSQRAGDRIVHRQQRRVRRQRLVGYLEGRVVLLLGDGDEQGRPGSDSDDPLHGGGCADGVDQRTGDGQTYSLGAIVATAFSCADQWSGDRYVPGFQRRQRPSGSWTRRRRDSFSYSVTATSKDGQTATATIHYTVAGAPTARSARRRTIRPTRWGVGVDRV